MTKDAKAEALRLAKEAGMNPGYIQWKVPTLVRLITLARAPQQAKLDALMLEYCPDEMSEEQMEMWASSQQVARQQPAQPPAGWEQDAKRYQWLRERWCSDVPAMMFLSNVNDAAEFDAAIDAAIDAAPSPITGGQDVSA